MQTSISRIFLFLGILIISIIVGKIVTTPGQLLPLMGLVIIAFLIVSFRNPETGLIILVYSMLLSPEITLSQLPGRTIAIRLDDFMILVLLIVWLAHMALKKDIGFFKKTPLNRPIILYVIICILFTARAMMIGFVQPVKATFYVLKYIEYFALYMMTVNLVKDKKFLKKLLFAGAITYVIVIIHGYVLILQGVPRIYAPFDVDPLSKSGECAALGGYLLVLMSVLLSLFCFTPNKKSAVTFFTLFAFSLPVMAATLSRASFLGFAVLCVIIIIFATQRRMVVIGTLVFGLAIAPIFLQYFVDKMIQGMMQGYSSGGSTIMSKMAALPNSVRNRVGETFASDGSGGEAEMMGMEVRETSALLRIENWKKGLYIWLPKQPFFGHGITGVGLVDTQIPLTIGELGLVGLMAFLWLLWKVGKHALYNYRSIDDWLAKSLSLGLFAALIALFFQSTAVNTFITIRIMEPFWFLTGLVMVLPEIYKDTPSE
ncbi:MAG: hypothetical protein A2252_10740 [Elusimicrobia bacterium RIFOXYA2_FULL_39_19]|nr:MAG: hypothetical protein A2252_10740 [Elusimicrobia bacterium RIFOXYA2_FULL_39_19]